MDLRIADKIAAGLFLCALLLLPAAEWRSIVLPVSGKPLGFDHAGQASASPFDLVFLLFCAALIPAAVRFFRERSFQSPYLLHWLAAAALLGLMLVSNEHSFPFLTPAVRKVVDARSLLLHATVMGAVAILVSGLTLGTITRGMFVFCAVSALGLAVLSILALMEVPLFRFRYPFVNPTHVVFPFPTYNVAAGFVVLACIGFVCSAYSLGKQAVIVLGVPIFVLAGALTGSRSSLLLLFAALAVLGAAILARMARRTAGLVGARRAGWAVAGTASIAAAALALGYDWQPIRRALSIFGDVAADPAILLWGHPDSPRHEMWRLARAGKEISEAETSRDYSVVLTSMRNGCVRYSQAVSGLKPGREYWLSMRQSVAAGNGETIIEVFADPARSDLVGSATLEGAPHPLPNLSLYLADTVSRYVVQKGVLSDFEVRVDGKPVPQDASQAISYFDPLNGAPGVPVARRGDVVEISAKDRKIRGYVNWGARIPEAKREIELRYRISLERVTYTLPLDAPAMFYVGLHDTEVSPRDADWTHIRNATLIQHLRLTSPYERDLLVKLDAEEIWARLSGLGHEERRIRFEHFMRERRCNSAGAYPLAEIWKAKHSEAVQLNFDEMYAGRVARWAGREGISVISDPSWSARRHIRDGGSTHNVYLDWYYYESPAALALFLAFAATLAGGSFITAWQLRRTQFAALGWAVHMQVVAILLLMYAQPYIWIKYYWVVFGIASALAIHPELRRRGGA